jgi:hypothetical protein
VEQDPGKDQTNPPIADPDSAEHPCMRSVRRSRRRRALSRFGSGSS